jgi:hypothetical protein
VAASQRGEQNREQGDAEDPHRREEESARIDERFAGTRLRDGGRRFRRPRHIIEMMVAMTEPMPRDVMVDPACGTCGFPVAVGEYLREHHPELLSDPELREHFNHGLFHGFDFDNTMLRIVAMNMLLNGVENPDVSYRDSLSEDSASEEDKYTWSWPTRPSPTRWITRAPAASCSGW